MTDKLLELATKLSTKSIDEQIVRIERLDVSLMKISTTFSKKANPKAIPDVQSIHLQIIENILYQDIHLFIGKPLKHFYKEFFILKDRLDTGILELPLSSEEHNKMFLSLITNLDIIKKILQKRAKKRKLLIILFWCFSLGIIIPFSLIILLGQVIDSSIWKFF